MMSTPYDAQRYHSSRDLRCSHGLLCRDPDLELPLYPRVAEREVASSRRGTMLRAWRLIGSGALRLFLVVCLGLFVLCRISIAAEEPVGQSGSAGFAFPESARQVFPILKGGKIGFIDRTGALVLEPTFDKPGRPVGAEDCGAELGRMFSARDLQLWRGTTIDYFPQFHEGIAIVMRGGKLGFVREDGKVLYEPQFDRVTGFAGGLAWAVEDGRHLLLADCGDVLAGPFDEHGLFHDGICAVRRGGAWGVINGAGELLVPCTFDEVPDYQRGLIAVRQGANCGVIDWNGKWIIEPEYEHVSITSVGTLRVRSDGRYGLVDARGAVLTPPQYDFISLRYSEGFTRVGRGEKHGFINGDGLLVVPPKFDFAGDFQEGRAWVEIEHEFGYINQQGEWVIPPQFDEASSFCGGSAVIARELPGVGNRRGLIDRFGLFLIEPSPEILDIGFGHSDLGVIRCIQPDTPGDDEARKATGRPPRVLMGIINRRGEFLWEPKYESIALLDAGRAIVKGDDGLKRIVRVSRDEIIAGNSRFSRIDRHLSEGLRKVATGDYRVPKLKLGMYGPKYGFINQWGDVVIQPEFAWADRFDRGLAQVNIGGRWTCDYTLFDGKWGYIDRHGNWIWKPTR